MESWLVENWFDALSAVGIIGGLFFTAVSLRSDAHARKIANLLTLTTNHREIWKEFFRRPDLVRVLDSSADVARSPATPEEKEFVNFVILHLATVFYATKDDAVTRVQGLRRDVGSFFSLPLPGKIWEAIKPFQNDDFIGFVEECRKDRSPL